MEELGELDKDKAAGGLASELSAHYSDLKSLEQEIHQLLSSLETRRRTIKDNGGTPINYMLQLPPAPDKAEVSEKKSWLHTLPDRLTGKSNCEMRVELGLLAEAASQAKLLHDRVCDISSWSNATHMDWGNLLDELAKLDFTVLRDDWLQLEFK